MDILAFSSYTKNKIYHKEMLFLVDDVDSDMDEDDTTTDGVATSMDIHRVDKFAKPQTKMPHVHRKG